MRMFNVFKRLVPDVTTSPLAKASTPDEMIAGAIVKSFATEFDDWTVCKPSRNGSYRGDPYIDPGTCWKAFQGGWVSDRCDNLRNVKLTIENKKAKLTLTRSFGSSYTDSSNQYQRKMLDELFVNGILLNKAMTIYVVNAYSKMAKAHEKAKEVAAAAKAEMEANERKWNLVEKLVGLKRNEHGALVPVHTEESIKTCTSSCCQPKGDLS